jgi:MOSC domain
MSTLNTTTTLFPETDLRHLTREELEAGLDEIRRAPKDEGLLELIVRRPGVEQREILREAHLDLEQGVVGDNWIRRRSSMTADGSPHPEMQINIMSSRVVALVAQSRSRWHLAGDQFYLDMDLSAENMPAGTRLEFGTAVLEVTAEPHLGCRKFLARFGVEAMKFVNSELGKQLHLRGINAKVVKPGVVKVGSTIKKLH